MPRVLPLKQMCKARFLLLERTGLGILPHLRTQYDRTKLRAFSTATLHRLLGIGSSTPRGFLDYYPLEAFHHDFPKKDENGMYPYLDLIKIFVDFAKATDEAKLYPKYGILIHNMTSPRQIEKPAFLASPNAWQVLDRNWSQEVICMRYRRDSSLRKPCGYRNPPIIDTAVREVAQMLKMNERHLIFEINSFCVRCEFACDNIPMKVMLEKQAWTTVAKKLYHDLNWLHRYTKQYDGYNQDFQEIKPDETNQRTIQAVEAIRDAYFRYVRKHPRNEHIIDWRLKNGPAWQSRKEHRSVCLKEDGSYYMSDSRGRRKPKKGRKFEDEVEGPDAEDNDACNLDLGWETEDY
ncbi:hypothetical protein MMC10_008130 [Thelotrema lepadinum]|nr:hypothetical protein [Thelotrema lepadinum]